jgi:chaperonin GroES
VTFRAYQDNVVLRFERLPTRTASGLHLPESRAEKTRQATVVAVGPGHVNRGGHLVPTHVQVGDRVLVDARAGQDYALDLNVPRHNKPTEWSDERGEFRIVREEEILAVLDEAEAAE